ncbi:hypothetical protein Mp_1g03330 [Marchantia polymorpha subsp. ruderalis]|uniref:HAT C-terminal dimerisation domain-containing protein n=2 Tax=Marchantia polymorpha TaxID=3197 RepID=A0AAF6AL22_MARPO|nr:hypothetical protein MARPO_0005s0274 [Marchantia polymorpha]BBM97142.1 hypothetical protein Mp_1g03330 [Marchantia polymorpha subsp. ruderalis]|eukprot:PTQ48663.1 hypothetical protein MARPO_0005s0274 [Marchantia polymorpha]
MSSPIHADILRCSMAKLSLIADSIPYSSPISHEDSIVFSGRTTTTSMGHKRKAKTYASWVWNHFKLVKDSDKSLIICLEPIGSHNSRCTSSFLAKTRTSSLSRHLLVKHNISKSHKSGDPLQTFFGVNGELQNPYELNNESKEANLNALIAFVVNHQQAFNLIKAITSDSGGEMPPAMIIVRENLNDQYSLRLEDGFHIHCICHVINRAVCDATHFIKKEVQMLYQILKAVCGSVAIRVKFSELAVVLGVSKSRVEVRGLDMKTRWNTMFTMIDQSFQYRGPLIYKHLLTLCEKTRSGQLDTRFTTPIVKQAATAMELKLLKYSANLNCQASKMALLLDPRSCNASSETQRSASIHFDDGLRLVFGERESDIENFAHIHEINDFFMLTAKADRRVSDVLLWWKHHSNHFQTLSMMARDTLMIQGSFMACESAFLESSGFVCPDRSKLSDENIEMMMKLKSWNRLFRK